jgi:NADPH-dependent 2,4-dienoyl-CoA reductase/sulfur reductase-like enzyme
MHGFQANRRQVLQGTAAVGAAAAFPRPAVGQNAPRVVVIGGGFGGANCARALRAINPGCAVTLVVESATYTAFPLSNAVLAGLRPLTAQQFGYQKIAAAGVTVAVEPANTIDPKARTVTLRNGDKLGYDRLVIAPGVDLRFDAIKGYSEQAAQTMPHAWTDGAQVGALRQQLEAMPDGGTVVISVPVAPVRCPLGPYERASMIASYLKVQKPRSKMIVLDAKDSFIMQRQFERAWAELYPGMIEWVGLSQGGNVTAVEVADKAFVTDFETYRADVANVIPPQVAGRIARSAGVADRTGWCPVDPVTFESQLVPNVHVIGDSAIAGAMPKAASAASVAAKICAAAIAKLLGGDTPDPRELASNCYSLLASDSALAIAGTYRPVSGQFVEVEGSVASSPVDASPAQRTQDAKLADAWFATTMSETFG